VDIETRWRRLMVPALYLLILLNGAVAPLLGDRESFLSSGFYDPSAALKWFTRLTILTMLTICVARVIGGAFSRENRGVGGTVLLIAFAAYFLASVVLSSAFGRYPEFRHDQYYVPFLFAAIFASRVHDPEIAVRFAKIGFLIFIAGSWVLALVAPDWAFERNYDAWIPGVTVRFFGLENQANPMGALSLAYLLLAVHQPFERRWLQWLGLILGVAALLAAQSKTTWVAAALALPLMRGTRSGAGATAGLSVLGLGAAVSGALLVLPIFGVSLEGLANSGQGAQSLSGRDDIWALAMQEWMRNPLFGYGLTMWDTAYRLEVGMDHAVSAHNQFMETVSVAGTVGLVGLVFYLGALSFYAIRAWRASHGLSVALLILLLARCVTETPVTISGPLGSQMAAQLLLFQLALAYGSKRRSGS
jgi:O-antigen ligase